MGCYTTRPSQNIGWNMWPSVVFLPQVLLVMSYQNRNTSRHRGKEEFYLCFPPCLTWYNAVSMVRYLKNHDFNVILFIDSRIYQYNSYTVWSKIKIGLFAVGRPTLQNWGRPNFFLLQLWQKCFFFVFFFCICGKSGFVLFRFDL